VEICVGLEGEQNKWVVEAERKNKCLGERGGLLCRYLILKGSIIIKN
jgi:hypothetical protein